MIELISCGHTVQDPPPADLVINCLNIPDPSPVVLDTPGTDPRVGEIIIEANPLVEDFLQSAYLTTRLMSQLRDDVRVVFVCSAGFHRSVFAAEYVAAIFRQDCRDVAVVHRDLPEGA
ncbi:hypothetical protein CPHO_07115 [Corynebacterium phocae]|uniref:RapZ C-terminal domain-containing protein n=1 Tax=Corynebacterium phocae TaxID=161895 RepID=A0A1L7D3H2_9CORY|nr:RNase adapter RapZ [Corynebacterium phocae]APT92699.1 hypothetical protein CPHO_07115 [Corynebacterium phocae]KAA8723000.1 hypothetical protein F4V58_06620 [Corynebacterium phocae]